MVEEKVKGKKWGVRVVPDLSEIKRGKVVYNTFIDTPRKTGVFVTNPAIQRAIKKNFNKQLTLGEVKYIVNPTEKTILSYRFQPLGPTKPKKDHPGPKIKGIGVGGLVELAIIKDLKQRFPNHAFRRSLSVQAPRRRQLERMGINPKREFKIEDYYSTLLNVVRKNVKKARAPKPAGFRARLAAVAKKWPFRRAR
jgi:hypothetical protein